MKMTPTTAPELVQELLSALREQGSVRAATLLDELQPGQKGHVEAEAGLTEKQTGVAPSRWLGPPKLSEEGRGVGQKRESYMPLRLPTGDYLRNGVVPDGQYDVVCTMVWTGGCAADEVPTCVVAVRILPLDTVDPKARNQVLFVTLHGTDKSKVLHDKFCETFRICKSYDEAVGRVGRVYLRTDSWNDIVYSGVHLLEQSMEMRRNAETLQAEYDRSRTGATRTVDYSVSYAPEELGVVSQAICPAEGVPPPDVHRRPAWGSAPRDRPST
jgi:hypothetical protein